MNNFATKSLLNLFLPLIQSLDGQNTNLVALNMKK